MTTTTSTDGTGTTTTAVDNGDGTGTLTDTTPTGGGAVTVATVPPADAAYAIDGTALDNPTYGWRVKQGQTNPGTPVSRSLTDFNAAGRDGTVQVRGFTATPTVTFEMTTPHAHLEALRTLLTYGRTLTLVSTPSIALNIETVNVTVSPFMNAAGGIDKVVAVFRCPDVYWRDVSTTDYGPATISASGQDVQVLTPSTAPVRDALVCVNGVVTNPQVNGANGTYVNWAGTLAAGTFLTFDCKTGRAWTGAAAFALTTEVTSKVGSGRGPYYLELVHSSDPASSGLTIGLAGASMSSPTITVRARNAYNR